MPSSGTTGKPTVVAYTRRDIDTWSELMARCYACAGVTARDMVQNAFGYGLFTGGLGFHYGAWMNSTYWWKLRPRSSAILGMPATSNSSPLAGFNGAKAKQCAWSINDRSTPARDWAPRHINDRSKTQQSTAAHHSARRFQCVTRICRILSQRTENGCSMPPGLNLKSNSLQQRK